MKFKKFSFFSALMMCVGIGVVLLSESCQKEKKDLAGPSSWLSLVGDDRAVCTLSLPGAHDAATYTMNQPIISNFAKTQAMRIGELFEEGVRVFDLRPALVNGELEIYHGAFETGTSFADAVEAIVQQIVKNPTEFAIIIIRHEEEGDGNEAAWGRNMHKYLSSLPRERVMQTFDAQITVGELRGRLLFLSRDEYENGPIGGYINEWYSGTDIEKQKQATVGEGTLWVQDLYDPESKEAKLSAIRGLLEEFSVNSEPGVWCINHTSGYTTGIFGAPNYGENAENVNGQTAEWIEQLSGKAGIVMMDFAGVGEYNSYSVAGDRLVKAVVNNNPLTRKIIFR